MYLKTVSITEKEQQVQTVHHTYYQKGSGSMVVDQFNIGNTKINICDDYCKDTTPEEVEQILADLAKRLLPYMLPKEENTL